MSLSGMFNTGHDVGGFSGPVPDPELLVRWVQNGLFSPRFIMNSWKAGGEVNTPWLHPEVLELIRAGIRFRYRLMPYLYTLFRRAAVLGEPVLRPLFYEFEDDPRAFTDCDEFMLGPYLLVANVVEPGARERRVYLPSGVDGWYDFHSGAYHQPGSEVIVAAPLDRIPIFARAGAMLPLTGSDDSSRLHDEPSRHLRVFASPDTASTSFALYEDDGISLRYREGDYAEVAFNLETTPTDIMVTARVTGHYALPYRQITVGFSPGEQRRVALSGVGVALVSATRQ
jgi:alpha-glucosidase